MLRQHLVSEINTVLNDNKKGIGIVELLPDLLQAAKYGRVGQNAPINRKRKGTCLVVSYVTAFIKSTLSIFNGYCATTLARWLMEILEQGTYLYVFIRH